MVQNQQNDPTQTDTKQPKKSRKGIGGPKTPEGKAIVSQNARKHGLRAANPPLLKGEDLITFQGIMDGLITQYQPVGPLEMHFVNQIAMCMQKHYRIWESEAALIEAERIPGLDEYQKNSLLPLTANDALTASQKEERAILTELLEELEDWDWLDEEGYLSKQAARPKEEVAQEKEEFEADGSEWPIPWYEEISWGLESIEKVLSSCISRYPKKLLPEKLPDAPDNTFIRPTEAEISNWLEAQRLITRRLIKANHPYGHMLELAQVVRFHEKREATYKESNNPAYIAAQKACQAKYDLKYSVNTIKAIKAKLADYEVLEAKNKQTLATINDQQEKRQSLLRKALPEKIALMARYETHTSNQLEQAIAQLAALQEGRQK